MGNIDRFQKELLRNLYEKDAALGSIGKRQFRCLLAQLLWCQAEEVKRTFLSIGKQRQRRRMREALRRDRLSALLWIDVNEGESNSFFNNIRTLLIRSEYQNQLMSSSSYDQHNPSSSSSTSNLYHQQEVGESSSSSNNVRYCSWEDRKPVITHAEPMAHTDRPTGLRHFSTRVCEKVEQKGLTNYNEVTDELVAEYFENKMIHQVDVVKQEFDIKNIRRRVHDVLNVLLEMEIISKSKEGIRWIGFPESCTEPNSIFHVPLLLVTLGNKSDNYGSSRKNDDYLIYFDRMMKKIIVNRSQAVNEEQTRIVRKIDGKVFDRMKYLEEEQQKKSALPNNPEPEVSTQTESMYSSEVITYGPQNSTDKKYISSEEDSDLQRALQESLRVTNPNLSSYQSSLPEDLETMIRNPNLSTGLHNAGNTCWFNCVAQILYHLPKFRSIIYHCIPYAWLKKSTPRNEKREITLSRDLVLRFRSLFAEMQFSTMSFIDTTAVLEVYKIYCTIYLVN